MRVPKNQVNKFYSFKFQLTSLNHVFKFLDKDIIRIAVVKISLAVACVLVVKYVLLSSSFHTK